jgi:hypothetical protein
MRREVNGFVADLFEDFVDVIASKRRLAHKQLVA